ncbi:MAG TPA: hypothetical protein VGG99_19985 [Acetobacteraceae bacterium]|jgi:hypothetical protein
MPQPDLRRESVMARAMLAAQNPVDHPIITRCTSSSPGLPSFAEGSPFLMPETIGWFLAAARDDVSLMTLENATRHAPSNDSPASYPVPESCTPYLEAVRLGYHLKPLLPILFVKNTRGELLLEARVALKYVLENRAKFPHIVDAVRHYAERIFDPQKRADLRPRHAALFDYVVQPYSAFTARHLSLRAGLWVQTPPGISTMIGPLLNRAGPVPVLGGAIETDWHHFELFVVVEVPEFSDQTSLIEPDQPIAQMFFVARDTHQDVEVRFSRDHPGAEPDYAAAWDQLGAHLVSEGRGKESEQSGVASIQIGCPHCFVSVTAAAENGVPDDHRSRRGFNPAYKILQREHRTMRGNREMQNE